MTFLAGLVIGLALGNASMLFVLMFCQRRRVELVIERAIDRAGA